MSDLGNREIFAKNLQYYMDLKNISRNELVEKVNRRFPKNQIRYSTLSDWINARTYPRIDKIEALSRVLNINKSDLVEDRSEEINEEEIFVGLSKNDISLLTEEEKELIVNMIKNLNKGKE